ncbi:MAG: hypothetical protein ACMUJM_19115 [bacterium]
MPISMIKKNSRIFICLFAMIISLHLLCGCGGETGDTGDTSTQGDTSSEGWQRCIVKDIDAGGMLAPHIHAAADSNDRVHVVYFCDTDESDDESNPYTVHYLLFDIAAARSGAEDANTVLAEETIIDIDNCRDLSFVLDSTNTPLVAYRGGELRECGSPQQSDAMFSLKENTSWTEYTGAIGDVERNPVFTDGLAGADTSVAFDSTGDIHLCYQFFYEGCDSMNYNYPDLCYVKKERSSLTTSATEETVEGNVYNEAGTVALEQNSMGKYCAITTDAEDSPVIFYYAEFTESNRGLRVARRGNNGQWESEWLEDNCEIGAISAAHSDASDDFAVAYYVKEYTDGSDFVHCLKYARGNFSSWQTTLVDESSWCGNYCSLAFDSSGNPAIAYYEYKTHSGYDRLNLKLARYDGTSWSKETVAESGDIGLYNTLWFDTNDRALICTYSNTTTTIYIYYEYYE